MGAGTEAGSVAGLGPGDQPAKPCMQCMLEMQYGFQGNKGPSHKHFPLQVSCPQRCSIQAGAPVEVSCACMNRDSYAASTGFMCTPSFA